MRISDWSSDVCSSDRRPARSLAAPVLIRRDVAAVAGLRRQAWVMRILDCPCRRFSQSAMKRALRPWRDRESGVEGKGVSVRVDLGGRRDIYKKKIAKYKRTVIC